MTGFHSRSTQPRVRWQAALTLSLAAVLAACGGGGDSAQTPVESCSTQAQNEWLSSYMDDWYFWTAVSPKPAPLPGATLSATFNSLLYGGGLSGAPADRWSGYSSTASYTRFFTDGQTMDYGLTVNGLEAMATPGTVLRLRYVQPGSDAVSKGLQRGDEIVSIGGVTAASMVSGNNFAPLTPTTEGQTTTVVYRRSGTERSVLLMGSVYNLVPVQNATVLTSPGGRKVGYVFVKDMISQASAGLDTAFAGFRAQNVQDLVIDLRYNGGGLVSIGAELASYAAGVSANGQTYTRLVYNAKQQANNRTYSFTRPAQALGLQRVFVLAGQRTCSASEQVVNGLRGVGVQAVLIGGTTCGKPVGFLSKDNCSTTFSAVNFEGVNAAGQGRYWDGLAATCSVAEDFQNAMNSASDSLTAAALRFADSGACPVAGSSKGGLAFKPATSWPKAWASDERTEMVDR